MKTINAIRRSGISIQADATITAAAKLMTDTGVGALAVLDGDSLVGIVTDRDLVRRGIAQRLAPDARIDGLMSSPVATIDAEADLRDAFGLIESACVRRLVVTEAGQFAGFVSVDDLLVDLAADLASIARPVTGEILFGHHDAAPPAIV